MFPKAHLTLHSSMSGLRWVTTPSWLSGSLRCFLNGSSVHSCYLFLISTTSVRSSLFLSFITPILAWNVPLVSPLFLKRSLVFPILLFSSISLHCSFKKVFFSLLAVLWNSAFSGGIPYPFSLASCFSSFLSYLESFLRHPLCLLAFLFLGDGFGHCLL